MLKALELAGFKSFADRTRFDFPDGITVVVGPNGSGKSNIVDAIKWVLGSQSAKSLRGKDMSDVIFKGSQTRGPANSAEATIIFDNSTGALPVEAPEVHVTRRVYRSGEAEYLINNQPVRLKDVKDLIRGTGIGIDAYSLIEQGKVDRMLQANPKDRRAIFEEAAGISRFKAKKVEAERRLARVQQNLTRLGDIVDEVASRLKSLKSQASKAERYRQATERLKELRTQVAWTDWVSLSEEFSVAEIGLAEAIEKHAALEVNRQEMSAKRQAADARLQEIADEARVIEEKRSLSLQRIAEFSGRREADTITHDDLRQSVAKSLRRVRLLQSQAGSAAAELRDAKQRLATYASELAQVRQRSAAADAHRAAIETEMSTVRTRRDAAQKNQLAAVRHVADLESSIQRVSQRIAEAGRLLASLAKRRVTAASLLETSTQETSAANERVAKLDEDIASCAKELELAETKVNESRRTLQRRRDEIAALQVRLQGVTERLSVLQDLQRRQEGLSGGVRAILSQLANVAHLAGANLAGANLPGASDARGKSPLSESLHGIVAECFDVDIHVAPLIDAALGERSQYVIVTGPAIQQAVLDGTIEINSRVGLVRTDDLPTRRPGDRIRLDGLKGVIGRGDRMIKCDEKFQPLARHLLASTWLVDSLATAIGFRKLSGAGLRFVTSSGELLENDGTIVVGPTGASTGLVSRRSELASADQELKHYRFQLTESEAEATRLAARVDEQAADFGRIEQRHRSLVTERAAAEAEQRHINERHETRKIALSELVAEELLITEDSTTAKNESEKLGTELARGRQRVEECEAEAADIDEMMSDTQTALQGATSAVMAVSVDLARADQKHEALSATLEQQQRDQGQREAAVADVRSQAKQGRARIETLMARILDATHQLATLQWDAQASDNQLRELAERAADVRKENRAVQKASEVAMKEANAASQAVHAVTAARDNARLRRETLASRMLEDYEIDLNASEPPEEMQSIDDRESIEEEIARLRNQVQNVGSVNMEALEELEGLQTRYDELHGQYQDLSAAKDSLQRIIGRINADSRRLFLDTLEAIRLNFQKLYRKSFGGGTADLILEDSDDPLEAGVEIVATPPGKPTFSNSLLSGGEKALTAVALLMSIFQYRPSPFCVLDEVDAPFDEANIGRFVTVLTEFLDQTKFVVVTHSKKTMTAATTLYGVTMQESGVSKQVSIRFEDVSEDGEIAAA